MIRVAGAWHHGGFDMSGMRSCNGGLWWDRGAVWIIVRCC